jgi:glycosyltransferase involved in cell wall biosynthesis
MLNLSRLSFDLQVRRYTKVLEKLYLRYEKIHGKPDVLHAQVTVPAGYAACILGKKLGIPVVITEHATYFQRFMTGKEGKYAKFALENTAALTCVGRFMQRIYQEEYGLTAQLLPNIVNSSSYVMPRKERTNKLRFASVCALRDSKRIDFAVKALKILKDKSMLPPFEYTVVGDGYYAQYFKDATKQMGMDDCVTFVGQKNVHEISEILSETDVLLVASNVETFCIPAVEALAAGVPVVSTKCGGPEDYLTEDCSELCDLNDPSSMADAIFRIYNRLDELDINKIRQVAYQFDGEVVANKAIEIYKSVLN